MKTAEEILRELHVHFRGVPKRNFKTVCPKCSHARKHKDDPCLSVRIDDSGVGLRCHNCGYTDGRFYVLKSQTFGRSIYKNAPKTTYSELLAKARNNWV